ncbi:MAG: redoxin domain-containing protein, partial [candidate division NC10 bacterium]|nr:redoxin domain-containing protein [candidate division NC10 bacterium]
YREIQKRSAEILQVTHNTAEEARLYFQQYQLTFPYLCDADRAVHRLYGVPMAQKGLVGVVRDFVACSAAEASDRLLRGEKSASPLPHLKRYGFNDPEQAVFIVDRDGIICYVHTTGPIGALPSTADLLRQLALLE